MSNPQDEREALVSRHMQLVTNFGNAQVRANPNTSTDKLRQKVEDSFRAALANQRAGAGVRIDEAMIDRACEAQTKAFMAGLTSRKGMLRALQAALAAQPEAVPQPQEIAALKAEAAHWKLVADTKTAIASRLADDVEALRAQTEAVPQGGQWKLVPVEPTPEMVKAGWHGADAERCYRAMLAAAPPSPQPPAAQATLTTERIAEIVRDHLDGIYCCTRVWEAWSVGTMSEDDFVPAAEIEMADEIAAALIAAGIGTAKPAPERVALTPLTDQVNTLLDGFDSLIATADANDDAYASGYVDAMKTAFERLVAACGITAPAGGGEEV